MSADLAAFLKARLNEDEAAARDSYYEGQRWLTEEEGVYRWPDDELVRMADRKSDARHIARHDPARVLREVEAKRALITIAFQNEAVIDGEWGDCHDADEIAAGFCPDHQPDEIDILRHLAAVYSAHPDYDQDWKP